MADKKTTSTNTTTTEPTTAEAMPEKVTSARKPKVKNIKKNSAIAVAAPVVADDNEKIPADSKPKENLKSHKKPAPARKEKEEKAKTRIRIKIMAYDHKVIDKSTKTIIDTARRSGAEVVGPIPLPMDIKKFTVLRSTFVHKDARDQYEIRTHKRLIDIYEPTAKTMEDMQNLNLPAGVDIEIKM